MGCSGRLRDDTPGLDGICAVELSAQTIALNANLAESLTLTLSANTVNFTLSAGSATNAGSAGITATTKWTLAAGRNSVGVYAYFGSATAALTDGAGDNIPSSAFFIADNAGPSTALTNTVAFGARECRSQTGNGRDHGRESVRDANGRHDVQYQPCGRHAPSASCQHLHRNAEHPGTGNSVNAANHCIRQGWESRNRTSRSRPVLNRLLGRMRNVHAD